jgi:hypothetical protein
MNKSVVHCNATLINFIQQEIHNDTMSNKVHFPQLSENEVALVRAEKNTGIIVDDKFERHVSENQVYYSVFENYEAAFLYINSISRKDTEYIIYGKNQEVLLFEGHITQVAISNPKQ